jgi:siroheme synthase-like protein
MAPRFPLYIDLEGNNCTIFGGGDAAASRAEILLKFSAKVTVISPTLCPKLREMDEAGLIRYIPRRYYRGDCSSSYLCVAATNNDDINIAISDECKAKAIAVNVVHPSAFGTFNFPFVFVDDDVTVSVSCEKDQEYAEKLCCLISEEMPELLKAAQNIGINSD